jgi:hypothetical protein
MHAAFVFWGVFAAANLAIGWIIAAQSGPLRSEAYQEVRWWLSTWWSHRVDLYGLSWMRVDYPPQALMVLLPLAWLPADTGARWFAALNVLFSVSGVWFLISVTSRFAGARMTRLERAAYTLMLLAWTPLRVAIWNGQTTPFLLALLFFALRIVDRFPIAAGVALALGGVKPQLALPVIVVLLVQRRFATVIVGAVLSIVLAVGYCLSVGQDVFAVLAEYVGQLLGIYGGPTFLHGEVDMRPLFIDLFQAYGLGEPIYLSVSAGLGGLFVWLVWRARAAPRTVSLAFSTGLLVSLAVFPFRRYGLMCIAPAILGLVWKQNASRTQLAFLSFAVLLLWLDFPFLFRHAIDLFQLTAWQWTVPYFHYLNRITVLVFLAWNLAQLAALAASPPAAFRRPVDQY